MNFTEGVPGGAPRVGSSYKNIVHMTMSRSVTEPNTTANLDRTPILNRNFTKL